MLMMVKGENVYQAFPITSASESKDSYSDGSMPESLSAPCFEIISLTSFVKPLLDFSAKTALTSSKDTDFFSSSVEEKMSFKAFAA